MRKRSVEKKKNLEKSEQREGFSKAEVLLDMFGFVPAGRAHVVSCGLIVDREKGGLLSGRVVSGLLRTRGQKVIRSEDKETRGEKPKTSSPTP